MGNSLETSRGNGTRAELFTFDNGTEVKECHVMIHATCSTMTLDEQIDAIGDALGDLRQGRLQGASPVFARLFVSDAANQAATVRAALSDKLQCAISIVQQPPLDGTKVALWVYLQTGMATSLTAGGLLEATHGHYRHLWMGGAHSDEGDSERQTAWLFDRYNRLLADNRCSLAGNCIRTWFFVSDIDLNYHGLVKARNEAFAQQGLTADNHFIASTGIGGRQATPKALVMMDAYAIEGVSSRQITYLHAPTHLNPTHEYGVSFERGTAVDYADRRHVFISGTASINNRGEVVHVGDIRRQTARMVDNVEALLNEAACTLGDVAEMTVYLRDPSDYTVVKAIMGERFPGKPCVIVLAPVCRPQWLVEMECMAIRANDAPELYTF